MKFVDRHTIVELAIRQSGKYAVFVANHLDLDIPYDESVWTFLVDCFKDDKDVLDGLVNSGLFLFDTEDEAVRFFSVFEYSVASSSGMYACWYTPDGSLQSENT